MGERDCLTPPVDASAMAVTLPDSELVVVPGAGHLTPLEAPEAVSSAILDWWELVAENLPPTSAGAKRYPGS